MCISQSRPLRLCIISTDHRLVSTLLRQIRRLALLALIPASSLEKATVVTLPGELLAISNFHVGHLVAGSVAMFLGGEYISSNKAAEHNTTGRDLSPFLRTFIPA